MVQYPLATLQFGHSVPGRHAGELGIYNTYRLTFPDRDGHMAMLERRLRQNREKREAIPFERTGVPPLRLWFRDMRTQRLAREESRMCEQIAGSVASLLRFERSLEFSLSVSGGEEHIMGYSERWDTALKLSILQDFGRREDISLWIAEPQLDLGRISGAFIREAHAEP